MSAVAAFCGWDNGVPGEDQMLLQTSGGGAKKNRNGWLIRTEKHPVRIQRRPIKVTDTHSVPYRTGTGMQRHTTRFVETSSERPQRQGSRTAALTAPHSSSRAGVPVAKAAADRITQPLQRENGSRHPEPHIWLLIGFQWIRPPSSVTPSATWP